MMGLARRFARDRRGVAAIEFALIAPVLVLLYCGVAELGQAFLADSRTGHAASTVGDLVAQTDTLTATNVDDIFAVGGTIMAPFPTASLQMRVTSVTADATGKPLVDWSRSYGGYPVLTAKTAVTVPVTMAAGDSVIMAQSQYQYTSVIQYILPHALTYTAAYYLRPRRSGQVTCPSC
jgi:Flp pilus assembly protein TadG